MQHFHHVGLEVRDIFAMERFYRTVLGFKLDYRYQSRNTPGLHTVFLSQKQIRMELLSHGNALPLPKKLSNPGKTWGHLSLECLDVDNTWEKAHAKATTAGYSTKTWLPPRDTGDGYREAVLSDPEGNRIELGRLNQPTTRPPIQAVIFDFDGTLADSEPLYYLAVKEMLSEFRVNFTEQDNQRYVGVGNQNTLKDLIKRYKLPVSFDDLVNRKEKLYLDLAKDRIQVFPKMKRFLEMLSNAKYPLAIASGSSRIILDKLLDSLGLRECFNVVISSDEVSHGKPAPDVFVEAAKRLKLPSQSCLVIEDSLPGVEAALRAFMPCLAIPSVPVKPLDPSFHLVELLVEDGMEAFDPEAAFTWLDRFPSD